jgi:hypothetical protein
VRDRDRRNHRVADLPLRSIPRVEHHRPGKDAEKSACVVEYWIQPLARALLERLVELDDAGMDPREELAFQDRLVGYADILRQEGGGVTKAWKPGAPPEEWAVV